MSPVKDPALLPVSTSIMELVYRKSDRERERKKIIVLNCFKAKVEYVVEGEGCKGKGCVHVGMAGIYCPFAGMVASRSCRLRGRKGKVRQLRESLKSGVSLVERRSHLFGKESREEGIWGVST